MWGESGVVRSVGPVVIIFFLVFFFFFSGWKVWRRRGEVAARRTFLSIDIYYSPVYCLSPRDRFLRRARLKARILVSFVFFFFVAG